MARGLVLHVTAFINVISWLYTDKLVILENNESDTPDPEAAAFRLSKLTDPSGYEL
jgi:hypothetical protein